MTDAQRNATAEPGAAEPIPTEPAAGQPVNPLLFVHRLLRGRYRWAVPLALLVAPIGAYLGYNALPPIYTSEGLVQVQYSIPKVLFETEENAPLDSLDQFAEAQARFLSDRRVLDKALEDPKLREAGWPGGFEGLAQLRSSLEIARPRRSSLIFVRVSHTDPAMAQAAVNAVLRAYEELFGERDGLVKTTRERALENIERELSNRATSLRTSIFEVAEQTGSADTLRRLHESRATALDELERRIAELELELNRRVAAGQSDEQAPVSIDMSDEALALRDQVLAQLLTRRDALRAQIRVDSGKLGPNNRHMVQLRSQLESVEAQIDARREAALRALAQQPAGAADATLSVSALRALLGDLRSRREALQADVRELGRKRLELSRLEDQLRDVEEQLSMARRELEALRVESQNAAVGRVTVASWGELPLGPSKDRRLPLAAFGAMACAGGVVGLFCLVGLLDRRWRYIDDAQWLAQAPLIGSLPDLTRGSNVDKEMAGASIHQLRNVLSLEIERQGVRTITVTSATAQAGKTSLTLALGLSFASAGWRTLVVDGDLVGGGLTDELKLRDAAGLAECFGSGEVDGEVRSVGAKGLFVLPRGARSSRRPEELSTSSVRTMLKQLRERFDVVLIDTGPLLGSLEANLFVSTADGSLVVAPRGQSVKLTHATLRRLEELGGRCLGVIFNRAQPSDVHRSVSRSSILSPYASRPDDRLRKGEMPRRSALAEAVAMRDEQQSEERASA